MGIYLEDAKLDSVLEDYFEEGVKISKPFDGYDEMKATYMELNKNKRTIEKEVNRICKEVFDNIKSQFESNKLDNTVKRYEKDFKLMVQSKKAPVLDYIDSNNSEVYSMELKYYPSSIWNECMMVFEDRVLKELNKSQVMDKIGLKFKAEDTTGIYVFLK